MAMHPTWARPLACAPPPATAGFDDSSSAAANRRSTWKLRGRGSSAVQPVGSAPEPTVKESRAALEAEFREGFELTTTEHFTLVHQEEGGEGDWVERSGQVLEDTWRCCEAVFSPHSTLHPPRARMTCVMFPSRGGFDRYNRERGIRGGTQGAGHYSPVSNRMVLCKDGEVPDAYKAGAGGSVGCFAMCGVGAGGGGGGRAGEAVSQVTANAAGPPVAPEKEPPASFQEMDKSVVDRLNIMHEACHMVAFNCGLLDRAVQYPWWVVEGMAVNFECPAGMDPFSDKAAGHSPCARFLAANAKGLVPLAKFVSMLRPDKADRWHYLVMYSQGWGLYHMLHRERPKELYAFLLAEQGAPPGPRGERAMRTAFESHFGLAKQLQRDWERFVATL